MKHLFILALLFISSTLTGQEKIPYVDYDKTINSINEAAAKQDYDTVMELIKKVNKNDSIYCSILTTKSYYLITQKKYDEAIDVLDEALEQDCPNSSQLYFYINRGVSLTNVNRHTEAIKNYEKAIERYPANAQLWSNKGIAYENNGQLKDAVAAYQKAITINPWYRNAQLRLGALCYQQQLMTQALMCYNMCLLIDPDSESAFGFLKSLNDLVSKKNENVPAADFTVSEDDDAFKELNLILDNKIALNNNYDTGNKIEIPLVKQNHALLAKIKTVEGSGGFWGRTYIPFYKWIESNDKFDDFIYTINYSIRNEDYKKLVEKNTDEVKQFLNDAYVKWYSYFENEPLNEENEKNKIVNHYKESNLQANGKTEGGIKVGSWTFYNENGLVSGRGGFNAKGERTGKWEWYHDNGKPNEIAIYKEGKLNGENIFYHENGVLRIKTNSINDELNGEYKYYTENGALKHTKYYKNGVLEGKYLGNFDVGEELLEFDIDYKNNLIENELVEYYANGEVFSKIAYKNGKKDGHETQYYRNGTKSIEANYKNDLLHGKYISYHYNGKPYQVGQAEEGQYSGKWKSYYDNGSLESEYEYDKGKLDNISKNYTEEEKLWNEFTYRKGEVIAYKYFDKEGQIIEENKKKGGEFYYKGYYGNGNLMSEGQYDISGGKTGLWKFYNVNGVLTDHGNYKENNPIGEHKSFYPDGSIKTVVPYNDQGQLHGYYQTFYLNGNLEAQGWYQEGVEHGEWRTYYLDKTIKSINYYHRGQTHGAQENYGVDGRKSVFSNYKYGKLISEVYFNPNGEVLDVFKSDTLRDLSNFKFSHFNKKPSSVYPYHHGVKHGEYLSLDYYGNKEISGKFLNGYKDGEWLWYYPNGQVKNKESHSIGLADGAFKSYYEDGSLEDDYYYENDERQGKWVSYYENGNVDTKTEYRNNKNDGRKEFYSQTGQLQLVRIYDKGVIIGYTYLGTDGKELPIIPIINETGTIKAFYDNGKVAREMEFVNGQLQGEYKSYFYEGQLENLLPYVNDEYHGTEFLYYEDGTIKRKANYNYGQKHGTTELYFPNGNIEERAEYLNNERNGATAYFNESGNLIKTEYYFNGKIYEVK